VRVGLPPADAVVEARPVLVVAAPKSTCTRTSALTGREAIAVEAASVLDSLHAVGTALGVPVNSKRGAFQARGLPIPQNGDTPSIEGQLGRRIRL
jgi:hypothetical protein